MLGFIYRNTCNSKTQALKLLYFSLVRSHIEFGAIVWSLNYALYINQVGNVQNKFLKSAVNQNLLLMRLISPAVFISWGILK